MHGVTVVMSAYLCTTYVMCMFIGVPCCGESLFPQPCLKFSNEFVLVYIFWLRGLNH